MHFFANNGKKTHLNKIPNVKGNSHIRKITHKSIRRKSLS